MDAVELPRSLVSTVRSELKILDQRGLPETVAYLSCTELSEVIAAIKSLAVRGAPAIGLAAAYGLLLGLEDCPDDAASIQAELVARGHALIAARPTAVNLSWAVEQMLQFAATQSAAMGETGWRDRLYAQATALFNADRAACRAIGVAGAGLIKDRPSVLTHCNAGSLAVSEYGTALAPIYQAQADGLPVQVWVDETRPVLQGARLTAYELMAHGVPCRLITDSMAAHVMSQGLVDLVLVGADRVALNGDAANKIGTLGVAILAKHYGIPFYVACPWSTVDLATPTGADIIIEERAADEVRQIQGVWTAPHNVPVFNPAFDVTPADLIAGIITERGILMPNALSEPACGAEHG
ncbi:MAG: methylthioribose-1-phosphate isomerase [Candidatus Azotimanducaceae bacterium]